MNIILFINVDDLVFIQNEINGVKKDHVKRLNTIAFVCATKSNLRYEHHILIIVYYIIIFLRITLSVKIYITIKSKSI